MQIRWNSAVQYGSAFKMQGCSVVNRHCRDHFDVEEEIRTMIAFNKIVYPTDFSPAAEAAFDAAQRLARDSQALLLIVHVHDSATQPTPGTVVPPVTMGGVEYSEMAEKATERAREELQKVIPADPEIRFEHRLLHGVSSERIVELAEEAQADLIVMGTHGRGGLKRLLMGSVAELVVRNASCPVLTLRQSASTFQDTGENESVRDEC
jgi:nucleotide-binding universal stress UspA family protein